MKVVVVGAGGFIGQTVSKQLAGMGQPKKITLVDAVDFSAPDDQRIEKHIGDLADSRMRRRFLDGADKVIVLAAILGGAAEANYALARKVNVDATLDLFEEIKQLNSGARVVFASTIAVYSKPMPDPVTDAAPFGPTMVYGAQKLMMEVALSNFSAKGWLDGISLRPSGVMARDGVDAGLKTAFMSRLFWAVRRGEDISLPVRPDSRTWLTSVETVAHNFVHGAFLPEVGPQKALTLPALSLTFGELAEALRRRFPESKSRVTFDPDSEIVSLFGSYPGLVTETADRLGFKRDANADELIQNSMPS
ncbi:NAD-dependent epimerase/dehydratase family protein [Rhizobium sp. L1K21]|uniref:NAD-dependent epimerase/dehydratase family protein n=1 Tax=Rhizobium sp. L1K21 TaxID=2954933 RepID=UPI00209340F3|nr:NAD-dependent epimerase/dehydratase family protein [Rhizobium sp. L1K21]MCO6187580.1 NAD-dependent epimerase/dehydratase family protein [Rhizobium sp. L1K21]